VPSSKRPQRDVAVIAGILIKCRPWPRLSSLPSSIKASLQPGLTPARQTVQTTSWLDKRPGPPAEQGGQRPGSVQKACGSLRLSALPDQGTDRKQPAHRELGPAKSGRPCCSVSRSAPVQDVAHRPLKAVKRHQPRPPTMLRLKATSNPQLWAPGCLPAGTPGGQKICLIAGSLAGSLGRPLEWLQPMRGSALATPGRRRRCWTCLEPCSAGAGRLRCDCSKTATCWLEQADLLGRSPGRRATPAPPCRPGRIECGAPGCAALRRQAADKPHNHYLWWHNGPITTAPAWSRAPLPVRNLIPRNAYQRTHASAKAVAIRPACSAWCGWGF